MTHSAELTRRIVICLTILSLALGAIGTVVAESGVGASGGRMIDVGGPHVELISGAADTVLLFEVTDANRKRMDVTESRAEAVVQMGSGVVRLPLTIDGPWLMASLPSALKQGTIIQFSAVLPGGRSLSAEFVVR